MASAPTPSKVTVAIVSFHTRTQLKTCLSQIEDRHEVIVVDNASADGSPEMVETEFPNVRLIRNSGNRGFGEANNQAITAATRPLVLLLNSDAYAAPGAIDRLAAAMDDPAVVACGGKLLNPDGSLQNSTAGELTLWAVFCEQSFLERLVPRSSLFNGYWTTHKMPLDHPSETAQVMGACLMMRPVERFDERFFLYCEDTDLCKKLSAHGRILYVPEAEFIHELGSSSSRERWRSVARYNRGKELYFAIHHGRAQAALCWLLNRLGAFGRVVAWTLATVATFGRPRNADQVHLFLRVLFAPIQGPADPRLKGG